MTTAIREVDVSESSSLRRYREAERVLWDRYGLEPTEQFIELAEPAAMRLRVVEVGSGRPVLFIPGTGGTGPYWAPLVRELAGFRCLMLDRPSWGLSTAVDYAGVDYGSFAATTLVGVLDALGLDEVDMVGASVGNLWALRLAQRHPDRVGRVALIGGMPSRAVPVPRFFKILTSPIGAVIVRIPMTAKMLRSQLEAIGHGPGMAAGRMDDFITWRVAFSRYTPSMRNERAMTRAMLTPEGWRPGFPMEDAELGQVQRPVRMIFGSADPTGSIETWKRFVSGLPTGELQIVDGAGHMPWWDDPQQVAEAVGSFIAAAADGSVQD